MSTSFFNKAILVFLLGLAFITSKQLSILDWTYWNLQEYRMFGQDFERLRGEQYSKINLDDLRSRLTPDDTLLFVSQDPEDLNMLRYQAYPIKVVHAKEVPAYTSLKFILNRTDTPLTMLPEGFDHVLKLRPDATIYASTDRILPLAPRHPKGWPYYVGMTLIVVVATWLIGRWVWFAMVPKDLFSDGFGAVMAFPAGFVALNLLTMLYAIFVNSAVGQTEVTALLALSTLPCLFYWQRLREGVSLPDLFKGHDAISATLLGLAVLSVLIIFVQLLISPLLSGDAVTHWMLKSKIIFHQGYDFSFGNRMEYPIFWSNYAGMTYLFAGSDFDQMAKWLQMAVVLSYAAVLYQISVLLKLGRKAMGLLLFMSFGLAGYAVFASTFAETVHTLYILIILYMGMHFIGSDKWGAGALVIAFLGLVMTKLEGLPQGVILAVGLLLLQLFGQKRIGIQTFWPVLAYAVALGVYAVWIGHSREFFSPDNIETMESLREPMTLFKVYKWLKTNIFDAANAQTSIGMIMGMGLLLVLLNRRHDTMYFYLLMTALALLAFAPVAILSWELSEIIRASKSATVRIFSHAIPVVIILVAYLTHQMQSLQDAKCYDNT